MSKSASGQAGGRRINRAASPGLKEWARAGLIATVLTGLYALVFAITERGSALDTLSAALANALPAVLLGWLVAVAIVPLTLPLPGRVQWLVQAAIVACYALVTYVVTIILLATLGDNAIPGGDGMIVRYFSGRAFIWQVFQGVAYGIVAVLAGLLRSAEQRRSVAESALADSQSGGPVATPLGRLLVRTDEGIVPIEAAAIIRIEAADDYSEIILPTRRLLARLRMSECETLLANEPMVRVHRSHIVNLRQLVSAEPAGNGRLQMLMCNGDTILSSRAGAQAFRTHTG